MWAWCKVLMMHKPKNTGNAPSAIGGAKQIVDDFIVTLKIMTLYAQAHSKYKSTVERLKASLDEYFNQHDALCLSVKKDRLQVDDDVVYQGDAKEGDLAFALFRDGMLNLSFQAGIENEELDVLLNIIHRLKVIPPEAEEDIVTALWEVQLPHVAYDAVADNIISADQTENGPIGDGEPVGPGDAVVNAAADDNSAQGDTGLPIADLFNSKGDGPGVQPSIHTVSLPPQNTHLIELAPDEATALKQMVEDEERRDASQEILDMMADILRDPDGLQFFEIVIAFLKDEIKQALSSKSFGLSFRILSRLKQVRTQVPASVSSAHRQFDSLFSEVSHADCLNGLREPWPELTQGELEKAKKTLCLLMPDAIITLGSLLSEVKDRRVTALFMDVIAELAEMDFRPLKALMETVSGPLLYRLVALAGKLQNEASATVLVEMAGHPDERVRAEALKAVAMRKLWIPNELVALLDDTSVYVRNKYLAYVGSRRCPASASLLLEYLKKRKFARRERDHQLACYRTLGQCGTDVVLPYLEGILFKGGLMSKFFPTTRLKAAVIALRGMNGDKAEKLMEKALHSRYPAIRKVANEPNDSRF